MSGIRQRLAGWFSRHQVAVFLTSLALAFLLVYFFDRIFVTIPAGHRGVLYRVFFGGTVVDRSYAEGLKLNFPWNRLEIYDVRNRELPISVQALSQDGLIVTVTTATRFQPVVKRLGELHKYFGPDYVNLILRPLITSSVREVVGKYRYPALYANDRAQDFEDEVAAELQRELADIPVLVPKFIVEQISLPEPVNLAIEEKLKQKELLLSYEFRLQTAQAEITKMRLDAEATAAYNKVVGRSLDENMLRYLGIKATENLANSPNAKVLMFGNRDGLPVILNLDDAKAPRPPAPGPPAQPAKPEAPAEAAPGGTETGPSPEAKELLDKQLRQLRQIIPSQPRPAGK